MKQGKTISGVLMGNKILNFENGILVEAQYTSPLENINVWEQDVNISLGQIIPLPFSFNNNDVFQITATGQTSFSYWEVLRKVFIFDPRFYKESEYGDPTYPTWDDSSTLYNGTIIVIDNNGLYNDYTISDVDYNSSHSYTYYETVNDNGGDTSCFIHIQFVPTGIFHVRIEKLTGQ